MRPCPWLYARLPPALTPRPAFFLLVGADPEVPWMILVA
jgi:hypothetical protein